MDKHLQKT